MANEERERRRRRIIAAQMQNAEETGDGENDARTQTSLEMGSQAYKEYVHDNQMNSNTDFDNVKAAQIQKMNRNRVRQKTDKVKERDYSLQERRNNVKAAENMRMKNQQNQKLQRDKVNQRKAYNYIKKGDMEDDAMNDALERAYETESQEDDERIERRMPSTLETIKYDDGITEDDYMKATSKAARKYM